MSTSSSSVISKISVLNKAIRTRHHNTSSKRAISKKVSVSVTVTKLDLPSPNKVLNNNNNDNDNKENNNRIINTSTIPFPNTTKVMANSVYE